MNDVSSPLPVGVSWCVRWSSSTLGPPGRAGLVGRVVVEDDGDRAGGLVGRVDVAVRQRGREVDAVARVKLEALEADVDVEPPAEQQDHLGAGMAVQAPAGLGVALVD